MWAFAGQWPVDRFHQNQSRSLGARCGCRRFGQTCPFPLPPQVPAKSSFSTGNPEIDFDGLGLRVATSIEPWPVAPDGRCYGGVNSFGFGGTNAHAVLATTPTDQ